MHGQCEEDGYLHSNIIHCIPREEHPQTRSCDVHADGVGLAAFAFIL